MAFCTSCGGQVADAAAFCGHCGAKLLGGGQVAAMPVQTMAPPIEYKIEGDNLQIVRLKLKPGQDIYAEAGKMVYKTANVEWQTKMRSSSGRSSAS